MTDFNKNIWFCGVPGSKWSGIDIQLRNMLPVDRTDETPDRVFYHRVNTPGDPNNGHRGSYWGPGMGCGEDWTDFNHFTKERVQNDINQVFTGDGYRIIKSHFFARQFNLDFLWNHFAGDYMFLVYREPQASFAWWCNVMDFSEEHWPDYRPGYTDYNHMRTKIYEESSKIMDFALRKNMQWKIWDPKTAISDFPGVDLEVAKDIKRWAADAYVAVTRIPENG